MTEEFSRKGSSANSTETGHSVEARYNFPDPAMIAGQLFDNRWRTVQFNQSEIGVPRCAAFSRGVVESGLLSYPAAQALRWWLHAIAEAEYKGYCLETRLVFHEVKHSWAEQPSAIGCHVGGEGESATFHKANKQ